jgi:hypothetical protein
MPELLEGQSRHRGCAQEAQTNRFTQIALTETRCLTGDAAVGRSMFSRMVGCARGKPVER